jgi:RND superfamily putative drug exporter
MLTLLPALLLIFGRRIFWPFTPRVGSVSNEESNAWARVGRWVERRPRAIWVTVTLALALLATGILGLETTLGLEDQFVEEPDSITGQKIISASFPAGSAAPNTIVANRESIDAVVEAALATPGVASVEVVGELGEQVELDVVFEAVPGTSAAFDTVEALRASVHAVPGAEALVGGEDAVGLDTAEANARDRMIVMPLVLTVVLVILGLLLRAIVAPLMLTATVVLSYAAAIGFSALVFEYVFGFAALEGSMPLLAFVFLVALGIDYNIFLMSRVHEEAERIGTHRGMLRGLSVTGGVITSAGVVLAATFAVLTALPLVPFVQIGFIVAFGVLLDTLIVRSILVPALTLDIGKRIWWPSALSRRAPATTPVSAPDGREPVPGD